MAELYLIVWIKNNKNPPFFFCFECHLPIPHYGFSPSWRFHLVFIFISENIGYSFILLWSLFIQLTLENQIKIFKYHGKFTHQRAVKTLPKSIFFKCTVLLWEFFLLLVSEAWLGSLHFSGFSMESQYIQCLDQIFQIYFHNFLYFHLLPYSVASGFVHTHHSSMTPYIFHFH